MMNELFSLRGTTILVAGGSGLIGKACLKSLKDAGAQVFNFDVSASQIGVPEIIGDVTQSKDMDRAFHEMKKNFGGSSRAGFINLSYPRTTNWGELEFEHVSLADFNRNVELQLGSTFEFTRRAVEFCKSTKAQDGRILNFSSIYGVVGPNLSLYDQTSMKNPSPYSAIKSGVIGITRYVATTYGHLNIKANVLCPGGVENQQPEPFRARYTERTPLKRMAKPDDFCGMVTMLMGPSADYITGQTLMIDGGWTAW